jgi:hypothetical protein
VEQISHIYGKISKTHLMPLANTFSGLIALDKEDKGVQSFFVS